MSFNPKKTKKTEVKLFSFINDFFNIIDYIVILLNIIFTLVLIFVVYGWIFFVILPISYFISLIFVIKWNHERLFFVIFKSLQFYISTPKTILFVEENDVLFKEEHFFEFNKKIYLMITFNFDYDHDLLTKDDFEKFQQLIKFFDSQDTPFYVFNSKKNFNSLFGETKSFQNINSWVVMHYFAFEFSDLKQLEDFNLILNESFSLDKYDFVDSKKIESILEEFLILKRPNATIKSNHILWEDQEKTYLKKVVFKNNYMEKSLIKEVLNNNSILYFNKIPKDYAIKRLKTDLGFLKLSISENSKIISNYIETIENIHNENENLYDLGIYIISLNDKIKNQSIKEEKSFFRQHKFLDEISKLELIPNNFILQKNIKYIQDFSSSSIIFDQSGDLLAFNEKNNPILIDLTLRNHRDRINNNHIIMGMSGSGKSYLMKKYLEIAVKQNINTIVIDVENEYSYINNDNGTVKFNLIFILNSFLYFEIDEDNYIGMISDIWSEFLDKQTLKYFIEWISKSYISKQFIDTKELVNFFEDRKQNIPTILKNLLNDNKIPDFKFEEWETNNFNIILNIRDFFNLTRLNNSTKKIFDKLIIFILNNLLNYMEKKNHFFALFIDEFHNFINSDNDLILYISQLVKQIRKRNGILFLSTQNIIDFKTHDAGHIQTIISNCNYLYLSKMMQIDLMEFKRLSKDSLYLSEKAISNIEKLNQGQFLLSIQGKKNEFINIV